MYRKYISEWVYSSVGVAVLAFILVNLFVNFGDFLDIYGDALFFAFFVVVFLFVIRHNKFTLNENTANLIKERRSFVNKQLIKISKPAVEPEQLFLRKILNKYDGRVYVVAHLDLEPDAPFTPEEVYKALQSLIREDFLDNWHKVELISEKKKSVKHLKDKSKDMNRFEVTFRIPKGVKPPPKPPYNGYLNTIINTNIQNVYMGRI